MDRGCVPCLHYITPVENLPSIARYGLLCHELADRVVHRSVALESVQDIRAHRRVPNALKLHQYVNLYIHARNSMMFYLKANSCPPLVVVKVSSSVLDIDGAVIADGNAAADTTRFYRSPEGLVALNEGLVFARSWNHPEFWEKQERKRVRSAEVLVPYRIPVEYVMGVVAETPPAYAFVNSLGLVGEVNPDVFFR